ncbi:MAG: PilZ domain-containing protein [Syntrophobacterales bacterium]|nr:MAG: PilZ domain-containing protein [Syntrophobacterales bacterium]
MIFFVRYSGVERRKHERFRAAIPVSIRLINLKEEEAIETQFKGITMDISMEGLSLELKYPEAGKFPSGGKLMGKDREFDLEVNAKLGQDSVRGVGEVRWASIPSPTVMKMGVFLKEIIEGETEEWRNFVISQS